MSTIIVLCTIIVTVCTIIVIMCTIIVIVYTIIVTMGTIIVIMCTINVYYKCNKCVQFNNMKLIEKNGQKNLFIYLFVK